MPYSFDTLRRRHPVLEYERYTLEETPDKLVLRFQFLLHPDIRFYPAVTVMKPPEGLRPLSPRELDSLVFHLGMIESISYWKCACPPVVAIRCGHLNEAQVAWWKELFIRGLGEFYYVNGIDFTAPDLVAFDTQAPSRERAELPEPIPADGILIPVGGGKDTAVTFEILHDRLPRSWALMLNPTASMTRTTELAGIPGDRVFSIHRRIDPRLLELNALGYLNGHTPFSAYLAFLSVLCARWAGCRHIVLSNERSSDYGNTVFHGRVINHQYSKSLEFETAFHSYVSTHIHPEIQYFSLLRVFHEIQIASIFARFPKYFDAFKSCNAHRERNSWCGSCAKCLFVFVILSPFVDEELLRSVFGQDLLDREELLPLLRTLAGEKGLKPFDCVGTADEVTVALYLAAKKRLERGGPLPRLLAWYKDTLLADPDAMEAKARGLLLDRSASPLIPEEFMELLGPWIP